ncbi:MAG: tetratricopeptide repeat protein [Gammaproteobacteria bacterium]|nr:tetratricopeptide repeat protein [Gammaproteobacteria bacterium]
MDVRPRARLAAVFLAGFLLAACASAQMWLAEAGWPAFPGSEARALLAEAQRSPEGAATASKARDAAEFAFRRDLYALALEAAILWHASDSGDPEVLALLTALHAAAGDMPAAFEAARAGLSTDADDGRFLAALEERLNGINSDALTTADLEPLTARLAAGHPESPDVVSLAARVALAANEFSQAARLADLLLRRDPLADDAHALAATALLRAGEPDAALARLTEQLATRDSLALEQNYVVLLLEARQPREALSRLRNLRAANPGSLDLAMQEARILQALGAGNIAEPIYLELFSRGYRADSCRLALGQIAAGREDWLESIEWLAGIESDRLAPAATELLVRAFVARDEIDEALATLLDHVGRYPRHAFESLPLFAFAMRAAGRDVQALAAYEEALRYRPQSRRLRMQRAHLLLDLEEHRRAIREMEDLLDDYPRDSEVLNALGYTLADRGIRLEEAHGHISLALELDPGSPAIVDSMGWVLYRLGRKEEAVPLLEQALESLPHPEVAAHLCEVLYELGQFDRADELLRESLAQYDDTALLEAVRERYSR